MVIRSFPFMALSCGTLLVSVMAVTPAAQTSPAQTTESSPLSPEDQAARQTFERVCSACHETERATTTLRTPQEWSEILEMMSSFGASATEPEFMQIQRYLNRRYGRVNVNRAPAAELQFVLDLSEEIAKAIVDYRATVRLTTADDLRNVAGFPAARIDTLKPHLQF
jgi:hypothetical protein